MAKKLTLRELAQNLGRITGRVADNVIKIVEDPAIQEQVDKLVRGAAKVTDEIVQGIEQGIKQVHPQDIAPSTVPWDTADTEEDKSPFTTENAKKMIDLIMEKPSVIEDEGITEESKTTPQKSASQILLERKNTQNQTAQSFNKFGKRNKKDKYKAPQIKARIHVKSQLRHQRTRRY